jgi:hypothetical protein
MIPERQARHFPGWIFPLLTRWIRSLLLALSEAPERHRDRPAPAIANPADAGGKVTKIGSFMNLFHQSSASARLFNRTAGFPP